MRASWIFKSIAASRIILHNLIPRADGIVLGYCGQRRGRAVSEKWRAMRVGWIRLLQGVRLNRKKRRGLHNRMMLTLPLHVVLLLLLLNVMLLLLLLLLLYVMLLLHLHLHLHLHPLLMSKGSSLAIYERLKPGRFLLLNSNHAFEVLQPACGPGRMRCCWGVRHMGETRVSQHRSEHYG